MANNMGWGNQQPIMGQMPQNSQTGQMTYSPLPQTGQSPTKQNTWAKAQPTFVPGRIVNSFDDIMPMEVPMDGNPAVFLKSDGSAICVKVWSTNGQLTPYEYILKPQNEGQNAQNAQSTAFQDEVFSRLDKIEAAIRKNARPYNPNSKPYHNKNREVKNNDESRK